MLALRDALRKIIVLTHCNRNTDESLEECENEQDSLKSVPLTMLGSRSDFLQTFYPTSRRGLDVKESCRISRWPEDAAIKHE